jgi:hypothetical protein
MNSSDVYFFRLSSLYRAASRQFPQRFLRAQDAGRYKQKGPPERAFVTTMQNFVDQRLPPDFCGLAKVAVTEPEAGCDFAAAAFFGLRISRVERVWPLAMANL